MFTSCPPTAQQLHPFRGGGKAIMGIVRGEPGHGSRPLCSDVGNHSYADLLGQCRPRPTPAAGRQTDPGRGRPSPAGPPDPPAPPTRPVHNPPRPNPTARPTTNFVTADRANSAPRHEYDAGSRAQFHATTRRRKPLETMLLFRPTATATAITILIWTRTGGRTTIIPPTIHRPRDLDHSGGARGVGCL